jgi:hypothetical protein
VGNKTVSFNCLANRYFCTSRIRTKVFQSEASLMETSKEGKVGLLHQILPPRLEDAGLEDCALPPDSIKEAFLKAAMAVKSRAASIFTASDDEETEGECVQDPWPTAKGASDALVGASTEHDDPGPCAAEKGSGVPEVGGDDVVVGGEANAKERGDEVVVVGVDVREGGRTCVQGLQGLEIGEEAKNGGGDDDEKEGKKKMPTLTEGFI